jgi:hypothetical protein
MQGSVDLSLIPTDIYSIGNTIYISDGQCAWGWMSCVGNIYSIDVSNPSDPIITSSYHLTDLETVDISVWDSPSVNWWGASSVVADQQYAFISGFTWTSYNGGPCGLRSFDVSDPYEIVPVGVLVCDALQSSWTAQDIYLEDGVVYAAAGNTGLKILDVSDPTQITDIHTIAINGGAWAIDRSTMYFFIAAGDEGLAIVETINVASYSAYQYIDFPCKVVDVSVSGELSAVACNEGGIFILDISLPQYPEVTSIIMDFNDVNSVLLLDDYLLVADGIQGLAIAELSEVN